MKRTTLALGLLIAPYALCGSGGEAFAAQAQQRDLRYTATAGNVVGALDSAGVAFESRTSGPFSELVVSIGDKTLRVTRDTELGRASVRSSRGEALARLELADLTALDALHAALRARSTEIDLGSASSVLLLTVLDWIGEAPHGVRLDIVVEDKARLSRSLCRKIGKSQRYRYDLNSGAVITGRSKVGPCLKGGCNGRCGRGCGKIPGPTLGIQRMTQACLNHDECLDVHGFVTTECQDEFVATFDDALFSTDCNAIEGDWVVALTEIAGFGCRVPGDCGGYSFRASFSKIVGETTLTPLAFEGEEVNSRKWDIAIDGLAVGKTLKSLRLRRTLKSPAPEGCANWLERVTVRRGSRMCGSADGRARINRIGGEGTDLCSDDGRKGRLKMIRLSWP